MVKITNPQNKQMMEKEKEVKPRITDRKPDETGIYLWDKKLIVNVWVDRVGRVHGSDDWYEVFIQTTDGKFVSRTKEIYSQVPSFVVGGKPYYK